MENMAENLPENSMKQKLRRLENNLVISGTGLMAFTVWSFIRVLLFVYTFRDELMELMRQQDDWDGDDIPFSLVLLVVVILLAIVALPSLYVAKAARDEGRRRKSRKAYIVLAMIMLIPQALGTINSITDIFVAEDAFSATVTAIIDITVLAVFAETVTTAIRVKKYRKELGIEIEKKPEKDLGIKKKQ
ncbi:MAG: hypothetical protein K5897_03820 [Eubacterium sp.]|nr:hypothetical protein [Eubacterium sp.]